MPPDLCNLKNATANIKTMKYEGKTEDIFNKQCLEFFLIGFIYANKIIIKMVYTIITVQTFLVIYLSSLLFNNSAILSDII